MARLSAFSEANLNSQGFGSLDDDAKIRFAMPLRFTPGLGTVLLIVGLALRSPIWLGAMAVVALSGALLPSGMLIDLVYNLGVRHLFGAPPLPPTPKPRQFSYFLTAALVAGSAFSFYLGLSVLGFFLGGVVVIGGVILTTTLLCLASWSYGKTFGHSEAEK